MTASISKDEYDSLLRKVKIIAYDLRRCFLDFGGAQADTAELHQVMASLDDQFLVVVVGEFNAGKSTFINVLLEEDNLLETGFLPTTHQITVIRHEDKKWKHLDERENILYFYSSSSIVRDISLVDTPGVNAAFHKDQRLTEDFVPRSDLILFIIAADRPFAGTEGEFLSSIRDWGRKVVILLSKIDNLKEITSSQETRDYIQKQCLKLLGFSPLVFPISAQKAQQSETAIGRKAIELWSESGFGDVVNYLQRTLDDTERLRLKLLTPLNGMQYLLKQMAPLVDQHAHFLSTYYQSVSNIDTRLGNYHEDLEQTFSQHLSEIENIILEMRIRGDRFFEEKIRLGNLFQLFKSKTIQDAFEHEVISNSLTHIIQKEEALKSKFAEYGQYLKRDILQILNQLQAEEKGLIRLVEYEHQFQQQISIELDWLSSPQDRQDRDIINAIDQQAQLDESEIVEQIQDITQDISEIKNYVEVAKKHIKQLQKTTTGSAAAGLSAGGLGVAAASLLGVVAVEAGALFGIALIGLGIYTVGEKRKLTKQGFDEKLEEWRTKRRNPLWDQYRRELKNATLLIQKRVEQYTTQVTFEQGRADIMRQQIDRLNSEVMKLKNLPELAD